MTWNCENSGSKHSEESDIEEEAEQGNHFVKETTLELRNILIVTQTMTTLKHRNQCCQKLRHQNLFTIAKEKKMK
jgi:hypothetical protein